MISSTLTADFREAAPATLGSKTAGQPDQRMAHSRLIGALFLLGFLFYGTGFALVSSVVGAPDFLATVASHQTTLVLGGILMLLPIITDVWRAVVFFPILGEHGRSTALTYLAAQIVSVVMFFIGVLSLLLIVPLGPYVADAAGGSVGWATAMGSLLVQSNENAYQLAQLSLAFGSLSLWFYGFRVKLIPRVFAGWALVGYVALLTGVIAELFGFPIGDMLLIPGALFELALPFWLFFKGFSAEAYGRVDNRSPVAK
ncbi:MAG: hypothetical protein JWR75_1370 [Devosia sp.]|nr:hypothetical protein [Devosia sp.]